MHDLKSLRGKCARINRDEGERRIHFDVSRVDGDVFEVCMRSDANEALYRGSGDACWHWIEGNGTGWLLAGNRAARGVMTEGMSAPSKLAPGDKTSGALRDSGRRLYAALVSADTSCDGDSLAGPCDVFTRGFDHEPDLVHAFLTGMACGVPQGVATGLKQREEVRDGR